MQTQTDLLILAFNNGIFGAQGTSERDEWLSIYRLTHGKRAPSKGAVDEMVAPLVAAKLILIKRIERAIKGCPGGTPRPATTTRTYYDLTSAGEALHMEWKRANPEKLNPWQRHVLELCGADCKVPRCARLAAAAKATEEAAAAAAELVEAERAAAAQAIAFATAPRELAITSHDPAVEIVALDGPVDPIVNPTRTYSRGTETVEQLEDRCFALTRSVDSWRNSSTKWAKDSAVLYRDLVGERARYASALAAIADRDERIAKLERELAEAKAPRRSRKAPAPAAEPKADLLPIALRNSITVPSLELFIAFARDAGNWSGTPLVGGNVGSSREAKGNLTQLKIAGLVETTEMRDRVNGVLRTDVWLDFTDAGRTLAAELGIDLA